MRPRTVKEKSLAHAINLLLVRHAISEANLDKAVNARLPDNRVSLAPEGFDQAKAAGMGIVQFLYSEQNQFFKPDYGVGNTRILCSPYTRTRQTSAAIEEVLSNAHIDFTRREELALREISFGLFDGIEDEELPNRFPVEHAHYQKHVDFEGEFYASMPMGESRVQVADRVKGVFGTILRDVSKNDNAVQNFIIVSHGVTLRTFIMQWMHYTPEWYDDQSNPHNASVSLITSDGRSPYRLSSVFEGFKKHVTKQEVREEGSPTI
jgi:2,3-bisphosphoglycerate-dependent phosphoglycerate mutase